LEDTVDQKLDGGVGDTNTIEHLVEVVRDETVTRPLGEEGEGNDDPHALPVSGVLVEGLPADVGGNGAVEFDGGLDFVELVADERILVVAIGVVVGQGLEGLCLTTLGDEPTRGLGDEPDQSNLEDGRETLENRGYTPCPGRLDLEGAEGGPGSNNSTGIPKRVVGGSERGTVGRVCDLSDQHRGGIGSKGKTETNQETSTNEHSDGLRGSLDCGSNAHDDCTNEDSRATTDTVREVRGEGVGREGTNVLDGVQETELATSGIVEVQFPLVKRLETVHHRPIITVGRGSDEKEDDPCVQSNDSPVVVPFPVRIEKLHVSCGRTARGDSWSTTHV